jgi:hypothetical protein
MTRPTRIAVFTGIGIAAVSLVISFHQRSQQSAPVVPQQNAGADNGAEKTLESAPGLAHPASTNGPPSSEVLRLRGEVGVLRKQADDLKASLAQAQQRTQQAGRVVQEVRAPLSEEYPKTPEAATTRIFQSLANGDLEKFVSDFGEPGVPKEMYDKVFGTDRVKAYLSQIDSVSVTGEPTNSFGPNMWFIPYKLHFKDGSEKDMQLHVGQDPRSQKWYFKGGI